jgi:hypothetical protein
VHPYLGATPRRTTLRCRIRQARPSSGTRATPATFSQTLELDRRMPSPACGLTASRSGSGVGAAKTAASLSTGRCGFHCANGSAAAGRCRRRQLSRQLIPVAGGALTGRCDACPRLGDRRRKDSLPRPHGSRLDADGRPCAWAGFAVLRSGLAQARPKPFSARHIATTSAPKRWPAATPGRAGYSLLLRPVLPLASEDPRIAGLPVRRTWRLVRKVRLPT